MTPLSSINYHSITGALRQNARDQIGLHCSMPSGVADIVVDYAIPLDSTEEFADLTDYLTENVVPAYHELFRIDKQQSFNVIHLLGMLFTKQCNLSVLIDLGKVKSEVFKRAAADKSDALFLLLNELFKRVSSSTLPINLDFTRIDSSKLWLQTDLFALSMLEASVERVSFKDQSLVGADLSFGKFNRVDFSNTDMTGAKLNMATFTECNLSGAKISPENLKQACFIDKESSEGIVVTHDKAQTGTLATKPNFK